MLPLLLCWVALSPIVAVLVGRATRASARPTLADLIAAEAHRAILDAEAARVSDTSGTVGR